MRHVKSRKPGFTLIEIIAVLVILGILAAVAVPKYLDMQKEAAIKATDGAGAAFLSAASMKYAKSLLQNAAFSCPTTGDVSYEPTQFTTFNITTVNTNNCQAIIKHTQGDPVTYLWKMPN